MSRTALDIVAARGQRLDVSWSAAIQIDKNGSCQAQVPERADKNLKDLCSRRNEASSGI